MVNSIALRHSDAQSYDVLALLDSSRIITEVPDILQKLASASAGSVVGVGRCFEDDLMAVR